MSEEQKRAEGVRYWWGRAHTSLQAARREAAAGDYPLAINRAYYARFYAVSALLLEQGGRFGKHASVRAAFNRNIIRAGRLSRVDGNLHNQLFRDRHEGDYVEFTRFDAEYVQEKIEACEAFLSHLQPVLRSCRQRQKRKSWRRLRSRRRITGQRRYPVRGLNSYHWCEILGQRIDDQVGLG